MSNPPISFIFFGTPDFSVTLLEELKKDGLMPDLVVTTPDKPYGRKMILTSPPVKIWAGKNNIPVLQPEKLDDSLVATLKNTGIQLFVIAAYGKILPKSILEIPKFGILTWHPSLLPKLRGPSPMISSILSENKTGVTIILIDEKMDHGPVIKQKEFVSWEYDINSIPTASELQDILAKEGGKMLAEIIPKHVQGKTNPVPQNHENATFVKKIVKEDGLLNLGDDAEKNLRKIRAFNVWPRAFFFYETAGKKIRVIVVDAEMQNEKLIIKKVLPEGGKEIAYEEFLRRYP